MKMMIPTVLLSLGSALAVAQAPPNSNLSSELQIGYGRQTFKMRDLQASPMLYVANLNGVRLAYTHQTTNNQWRVGMQAGVGDFIAPGLGIRPLKFAPEQDQPLWLAPTLYRGQLEVEYHRRMHQTVNCTTYLGVGLRETIGYADGLVLSTWAFNSADLRLLYQTRWQFGERHTLLFDASLPVMAAVSRMPYSNVVSEPNRPEVAAFFDGTRFTTLNRFINPELGVNYRFGLSRRVAFSAGYRYNWMRYTEPRTIRTTDHAVSASVVYKFQKQSR